MNKKNILKVAMALIEEAIEYSCENDETKCLRCGKVKKGYHSELKHKRNCEVKLAVELVEENK